MCYTVLDTRNPESLYFLRGRIKSDKASFVEIYVGNFIKFFFSYTTVFEHGKVKLKVQSRVLAALFLMESDWAGWATTYLRRLS